MCCWGLRGITIFASIFTLIQSLIGLAFSALVIVNYNNCINWNSQDNTLYYFYFYSPKCYASSGVVIDVQFNFVERTLDWGKTYLALNSCWLVASFLMAVCSCINPKKTATYFLYSPWIIVTIAIVIADLAATIIYFSDISKVQDTLAEAGNIADSWKIYLGPVVMGLIFSRLIIGWIINFGILICASVAVVQRWKQPDNNKVLTTMMYGGQPNGRSQPGAPPLEDDWEAGYVPRVKPDVDQNANTRPGDLPVSHGGHYLGPRVHSLVSQQPKVIVPDPRYRAAYVDSEKDKLSRSPKGYIPGGVSSQQDEKDVRPAGKQRPSYSTAVRSQLPWSYFQNPEEPLHPVPKQPGVEEGVDRPPVPVPDYTLHIGKRPMKDSREPSRSNSDASSGNSSYPRPAKDGSSKRRSSHEADVLY